MSNKRFKVLDLFIDFPSWEDCIDLIFSWSLEKSSKAIFLTNVHSVINAKFDPYLKDIFNKADLSLPDGRPLTWISFLCGNGLKNRINGPDLMIYLLEKCNQNNLKVYFYGSTQKVIDLISLKIKEQYKNIDFMAESPPFRKLTEEEKKLKINEINAYKPNILFVGLGNPKQEKWIHKNKGEINSPMIGVGAAFDFYSGYKKRAPKVMQRFGLEWLFRLINEPKRLFKRYMVTNTFFILFGIIQIFKHKIKNIFR